MAGRGFKSFKDEITGNEARRNYSFQEWDELLTQVRGSKSLSEMERIKLEGAITGAIEDRKDPLYGSNEIENDEPQEQASDWLMREKGISISDFSKMGIDEMRVLQTEWGEYDKSRKSKNSNKKKQEAYSEPEPEVVKVGARKKSQKKVAKGGKKEPEYYEPEEEPPKKAQPRKTNKKPCTPVTNVNEVRDNAKWLDTKFMDNGLIHIEEYTYKNCYYQVMRQGSKKKAKGKPRTFKDEIIYVEEM